MLAADERRDALGHRRVERRQRLVNAGVGIEDDALGPPFVVGSAGNGVLEKMRERAVADVVEERGGERVAGAIARDLVPKRELAVDGAEAGEEQLHDERRAESVGEAGVLGPGK